MSDESRRKRERAVRVEGGEAAEAAMVADRARGGQGRHSDKLGQDVVVETVQCHWYGGLLGITELGGGAAIAHLHPCWWLSNTEGLDVGGEEGRPRRVHHTDEAHPADVYLTAAVIVTLAPADWKRPR